MKRKLLIGISSFGLAAGFWACGEGQIEPMNPDTDEYVQAMLQNNAIDFTTQIADAKQMCNEDIACMNEMAKANNGAIQIESSETIVPESSSDPGPQMSSSSRTMFSVSSMGPIGGRSSSSEAPVSSAPESSSSVFVPAGQFGTCFAGTSAAPKKTAELNEKVTWTFKPNTAGSGLKTADVLSLKINWSFPAGTPETVAGAVAATTAQTAYAVSGTKTAIASVTAAGATQDITCDPLRVNGQKIEGCKCVSTNIQPDVAEGESATWTASGCTSKANITGYKWTVATAVDATGLVATAPVAKKDDEVTGVSFTVENDDSTSVTIQCENAKAIDHTKPDYEFKGQGDSNALTFEGDVDATIVFSLPDGWHNGNTGNCTFACQVDRGTGGNGQISGTLGTYKISGGDYVPIEIPVSATIGGNALAFKLTVSPNAGVTCKLAW